MISRQKIKIELAQNGALIGFIALVIIFSIINPRFFSVNNAEVIIRQVAELGIICLAVAFVVMAGGVDLSIGSIASVSAVSSAVVMTTTGSISLGLAVGFGFGIVAGLINGILISYFGLNPIVITLGFLSAWGGLALFFTSGKTQAGLPPDFTAFGRLAVGPVSIQLVLLIVTIALAWFVLNRTPFGRQVLAVGQNDRAAYLMGINVKRVRLILYVVSGFVAAGVGILLTSKLNAAPPSLGTGMELDALTVILLGGVAFAGGSGRISGVVAGLLLVGVLRNGLVIIGVSQFLQQVAVGLTLVVAVTLDGSLRRIVTSSWALLGKDTLEKSDHHEVEANGAGTRSLGGS